MKLTVKELDLKVLFFIFKGSLDLLPLGALTVFFLHVWRTRLSKKACPKRTRIFTVYKEFLEALKFVENLSLYVIGFF